MTISSTSSVTYWDASAAIPALFAEERSEAARRHASGSGLHLLSSLGWAEVLAVIRRAQQQGKVSGAFIDGAREALANGPWRWINVVPDRELICELAARWTLRGADLWHLAAAKTLKPYRPELTLLTFDQQLGRAAKAEGLS